MQSISIHASQVATDFCNSAVIDGLLNGTASFQFKLNHSTAINQAVTLSKYYV